jgi:hydrogenase maturation protein HypF
LARIADCKSSNAPPIGQSDFCIVSSQHQGVKEAEVTPDAAICAECAADITDPDNRRYRYPFTNCTQCGPRYSIIQSIPYDRSGTTMADFQMCPTCEGEYSDPVDRRFHAQPIACPDCGPELEICDENGQRLATGGGALTLCVQAIRRGQIVAVKGLGGFHLMCDARQERAVQTLRTRKSRQRKPFAIMVANIKAARVYCEISDDEEFLISSPAMPITLSRQKPDTDLASSVAPDNPWLGVMLPYTPLHHILLADLDFPVVATSGNRRAEPLITDNNVAMGQLGGIADMFLVHNRPIAHAIDDSVVRISAGRTMVYRRARGYAPGSCKVPNVNRPLLAMGGHLKNTVAHAVKGKAYVSPHIGDLESLGIRHKFETATNLSITALPTDDIICITDAHPDYASTHCAKELGYPIIKIQHHAAHIYACMAEHNIQKPVIGMVWDGAGYGLDGTVWGGETLCIDGGCWERTAHFKHFSLPGGDAVARDPARAAIGLIHAAGVTLEPWICTQLSLSPQRARQFWSMCDRPLNAPITSSVGRLFDAISALLGVCHKNSFEGEAAMALEFTAERSDKQTSYPIIPPEYRHRKVWVIDWIPMLISVLADLKSGISRETIARKFHNWLADIILLTAIQWPGRTLALSGGCFQNAVLLQTVQRKLDIAGLNAIWPEAYPPNDGGLSLGQIYGAALILQRNDRKGTILCA